MKKQILKKVVEMGGNRFFEHTLSSAEMSNMLGGNAEAQSFIQDSDSCGCLNCANLCCSVETGCPSQNFC